MPNKPESTPAPFRQGVHASMAREAGLEDRDSARYNPHRQRAFRTRNKTGCITCKIRKIRCDEQKPSCNRCVSTGRKCDGYGDGVNLSVTSQPHPARAPTDLRTQWDAHTMPPQLRAALPRKNDQELRSYRFFLDVTAPAIASVFDAEFWLTHIPRTCHLDTAIWHAAVSLGAMHEYYVGGLGSAGSNGPRASFALQQFNAAITCLIRPSAQRTIAEEKWRALTASVMFTYLCNLQGLYSQSNIHLTAAKNLIEELQLTQQCPSEPKNANVPGLSVAAKAPAQFRSASVPYGSVSSVVADLEINAQTLSSSGANDGSASLSDVDAYIIWRYYSAPSFANSSKTCRHGRCVPSRATPANLNHAGKAIKSLLNGLMALSQRNAADVARLLLEGDQSRLSVLIHHQQPYARAFGELGAAIDMFVKDTIAECSCFDQALRQPMPTQSQKKALDVLCLYHATCYPFFLNRPANTKRYLRTYHPLLTRDQNVCNQIPANGSHPLLPLDPKEGLVAHFSQSLDLAERVLQNDAPHIRSEDLSDFTPALPTTTPLLVMAHISGVPVGLRRRVIALLRQYPQREFLLDSKFAAAIADLILGQETGTTSIRMIQQGERQEALRGTSKKEKAAPETPLTNKVFGVGITYTAAHTARVMMQTWEDWVANNPGREELLTW